MSSTDRSRRPAAPLSQPLHVGRPQPPDRARWFARLDAMLDSGWLTNNGPLVRELEQRLAEMLCVQHCVAMSNGTLAEQLCVRALGLSGEVIVPSFTFIATAHALTWEGLTPVFCDVRRDTHTLDPQLIEAAITERTSAILAVHTWGRACDVERLSAIARRHGLRLLFDAAHAFGCTAGGVPIGGFGDAEIFSFHATKFFHTIEGGAVTTDDESLAARLRLLRNHGFAGLDDVVGLGINAKMNEVCAATGLAVLDELDERFAINQRNAALYRAALADLPGVALLAADQRERHNHQYIVVEIDAEAAGVTRDALVAALRGANVLARRYFHPGCHRVEPYRSRTAAAAAPLPVTELLSERVLCLPTGASVGEAEVDAIAALIRAALRR